jgi:DNA-binding HxlR family transcriptional regulator
MENHSACDNSLLAVEDALYLIGGKWKLRIIIALRRKEQRFNGLLRVLPGISARVLSNELKELEINGFIQKTTDPEKPLPTLYVLTNYSDSLKDVLKSLSNWGIMHREKLRQGE